MLAVLVLIGSASMDGTKSQRYLESCVQLAMQGLSPVIGSSWSK